jgi:hypothetical protein
MIPGSRNPGSIELTGMNKKRPKKFFKPMRYGNSNGEGPTATDPDSTSFQANTVFLRVTIAVTHSRIRPIFFVLYTIYFLD